MKQHLMRAPQRLNGFQNLLFGLVDELRWKLDAWVIFSNHYHFIGRAPESEDAKKSVKELICRLHGSGSNWLNELDGTPGRQSFYQYWETELTYARSYYARLHYVKANPVKHGLVQMAENYQWSSMRWFKTHAPSGFCKSVLSYKIDRVNVYDEFEVASTDSEKP